MKLNFILVLLLGSTLQTVGQAILQPLDKQVVFVGVVREIHGYGPPGYGEDKKTDSPIIYWVLELPAPINTLCTPERPEWASTDCRATKRLRLFFPTSSSNSDLEVKVRAMKGHRARIGGMLQRQDTAGEITPIYMNVTEAQLVQPPLNP
ncbi:MAG: hypothetical protein RB191_06895 [Terriglobia bacterium]|nr:hypothetical protein [Terriglobia bacterium]